MSGTMIGGQLPDGWIRENGINYKPAACTVCGQRYYVRSCVKRTLYCPDCRIARKRETSRARYYLPHADTEPQKSNDCRQCKYVELCNKIKLTATRLPCETDYPLYDDRIPAVILSHNNQVVEMMRTRMESGS